MLDKDLLEQIANATEQDRDALAQQIIDDFNASKQVTADTRHDSEQFVSSIFKAADFAPREPFTPPENIPGYDQGSYQQLKSLATEQRRALDIGEMIAQNHVKVEKIEGLYTDAALIQAQSRVKQEYIANEGLKLNQAIQAGKLIISKTEALRIDTSMQDTKNLTASRLVDIESQRGQALIEGAVLAVEGIRADNNALLLESQKDFESMRGAGRNGSYTSF